SFTTSRRALGRAGWRSAWASSVTSITWVKGRPSSNSTAAFFPLCHRLFLFDLLQLLFHQFIARIKPKTFREVSDGRTKIPFGGEGMSPAVVGPGVRGVEAEGLVAVGDDSVQLALEEVRVSPPAVGRGVLRVEADALGVVGDGPVVLALALVRVTPVGVGFG